MWAGPATLADLTALRRRLRAAVAAGSAPHCSDDADIERLLLAFEELASNALRHGRAPVRVAVIPTGAGWLLDISDAATDRPPSPAVGRDPAAGGLGLQLVARLAGAHGWQLDGDRKHVWAHLICTAPGADDGVAGRLRDTITDLTTALSRRPAVRIAGRLEGLREDLVTDLFAVLHESLDNVARHARARTAEVDITVAFGTVTLQVVDDGVGMEGAPRESGLADVRRRATWHGGTLSVGAGPAGGTQLTWSVPESRTPGRGPQAWTDAEPNAGG
jgi:signal transduction histidine kinase